MVVWCVCVYVCVCVCWGGGGIGFIFDYVAVCVRPKNHYFPFFFFKLLTGGEGEFLSGAG